MISFANTNQFLAIALPSINVLLLSVLLWQQNTPDDTQAINKRLNAVDARISNVTSYHEARHNDLDARVTERLNGLERNQKILEGRLAGVRNERL